MDNIPEQKENTIVSYFSNCITTQPKENISIENIFQNIKTGIYKNVIQKYRKLLNEKGKENEIVKTYKKTAIPAITYTGTFTKRASNCMIKPSNIIIIDIDNWIDVISLKKILKQDMYIYAIFISPGGNGLKVVFKIEFNTNPEDYKKTYLNAVQYLFETYNLPTKDERISKEKNKPGIDLSCTDISRLCLVSDDPELHFNPNAELLDVKISENQNHVPKDERKNIKGNKGKDKKEENKNGVNNKNKEKVLRIIEKIEEEQIDISDSYKNWLNIGFALYDEFDIDGRELFHRVSRINENYDFNECENQFNSIEKSQKNGITIKTFFKLAKEAGIDIRKSVLTSNKFILAKEFIEKHYQIRYNIITNEYECRPLDKTEFSFLNENNIFVKMQVSGLNIR